MSNYRNIALDLMRVAGILNIMLAHAYPPDWLFQLRNFATPLLILTSGATYSLLYAEKEMNVRAFMARRLGRLIWPAWIFLTFFFIFFFLFYKYLGRPFPFEWPATIISSYTFTSGIGFVWVLKVYIFLAIIIPWSLKFQRKLSDSSRYFQTLLIAYVLYEILVVIVQKELWADSFSEIVRRIYRILPYSVIAYTLIFLYGLNVHKLSTTTKIGITLVSLAIFSVIAAHFFYSSGSFVQTQLFRQPPTLYYLSYAFFAVHVVYFVCKDLAQRLNQHQIAAIVWFSSHSLWIYLWHIFAYFLWDAFWGSKTLPLIPSLTKTIFLLSFAALVTFAQVKILAKIQDKFNNRLAQKALGYLT